MNAKHAASRSWHQLVLAGKLCERAWTERTEDGRVRYAMTGLGLGLLVGSLLSAVGTHIAPVDFTGFGYASIGFLGFVCGLCLLVITLMPWSWTGESWACKRRPMTAQRLIANAITRANEDSEFREHLKGDPRRTVEREFGFAIPDDFEITVLEETPKHAFAILQPSESSISQDTDQ